MPFPVAADFVSMVGWANTIDRDTYLATHQDLPGPQPALSVKLPIPYRPPSLTMAQSTWVIQHTAWPRLYCTCSIQVGCTPFSEMYPYHMGHPMPAREVIVPYHTGWLRLYCTHTTRVGQHYIVAVPHGLAEAILYPYHTGWLMLYCTCTTRVGQGHLHMAALTIYITCLFW